MDSTSKPKKYGKSLEEKRLEKMIMCREIVKEILDFGVDEDQKVQVIKLLSLELENKKLMDKIVDAVKDKDSIVKLDLASGVDVEIKI